VPKVREGAEKSSFDKNAGKRDREVIPGGWAMIAFYMK